MPGSISNALFLLALAVPAAALTGCEQCGRPGEQPKEIRPAGPVLQGVSGTVEWRMDDSGQWKQAEEGQALPPGARLRTGSGGVARVAFADGREVHLGGGTSLTKGGVHDEFDFLLEQGAIELSGEQSPGEKFQVVFGSAGQMVVLRDGQARLSKSKDGVVELSGQASKPEHFRVELGASGELIIHRGGSVRLHPQEDKTRVEMIMGRATIRQPGKTISLGEGNSVELQPGGEEKSRPTELASFVRSDKRHLRLRPPGRKRFSRLRGRKTRIETGTSLESGRSVAILFDRAGGRVRLGARSRADFGGFFRKDGGRTGSLALERGTARVLLRRHADAPASQKVSTPRAQVVAEARGLTADVEVAADARSTRVVVHTGKAEIKAGSRSATVPACHRLVVDRRGTFDGPTPLPMPPIRVGEGTRAKVYYDRRPDAVAFTWKKPAGDEVQLEVSLNPGFDKLLLREPLARPWFILDGFHRVVFWRVIRSRGPGPVGRLESVPDPAAGSSKSGKLTNLVTDTGQQTKIIYQGKVPALTFTWKPVEGATGYLLRVYPEDDMETPVLQKKVSGTRAGLAAGSLKEDTYYWYQTALDAEGGELQASRMNKLVLAFDNAATFVRVDAPPPGARPTGGKIVVRGQAPPGSSITAGGKKLLLSPDGRFHQTLSGVRPGSTLVFLLDRPGRNEVYVTRRLGR